MYRIVQKKSFKYFIIIIIIILSIFYGILIEQKKIFPYPYLIRITDDVKSLLKSSDTVLYLNNTIKKLKTKNNKKNLNNSEVKNNKEITFENIAPKTKETTLLPIEVMGYKYQNLIPNGGAIEFYERNIIVSDKFGSFIKILLKNGSVSRLKYPKIPNNISEFYRYGDYGNHPHFGIKDLLLIEKKNNLTLFVSHHIYNKQLNKIAFSVSKINLEKKSLNNIDTWKTIFTSKFLPKAEIFGGLGSGGRLIEDQGSIILSIGDFNHDSMLITSKERAIAQNTQNEYGSIISIDPTTETFKSISIGHRNPQGLVKTKDGKIYSTEHGPRGGDELNLIKIGKNYGWPYVSTGMDYEHYSLGNEDIQGKHGGFTKPNFSWLPSIGVSNLIEINNFNSRWNGDLLVSSLKTMSVYRLRTENNRVLYSEPIFIGSRIRDLINIDDKIILWTDNSEIIILSVEKKVLIANRFAGISSYNSSLIKCMSCHHLEPKSDQSHSAPTLRGIIGKKFGSDPGFEYYSEGIKKKHGLVWDIDNLKKYLLNPQSIIPGTSMGMSPVTDKKEIEVLIYELTEQG